MTLCAECGYKIEKDGWGVERIEKKFLIRVVVYHSQVCSRACAEKLMKRLEARCPNVPYSKKGVK